MLEWLETVWPVRAVRDSRWGYPITESVHLAGIAVLVGATTVFDVRLLGRGKGSAVLLARQTLPWARGAFCVVLVSGLFLFSANATQLPGNEAFQLKLILLALAGFNVLMFHTGPFRTIDEWDESRPPVTAKAAAVVSLVLWPFIIGCGRFIAYA